MPSPVLALTYSATALTREPCAKICPTPPAPIPSRTQVFMTPLKTSLLILGRTGPATLPFSLRPLGPMASKVLALILPPRNATTGRLYPTGIR